MKLHAPLAADMLSGRRLPVPGGAIVRHHHENWDGTALPGRPRRRRHPDPARACCRSSTATTRCVRHRPYRRRALAPSRPRHRPGACAGRCTIRGRRRVRDHPDPPSRPNRSKSRCPKSSTSSRRSPARCGRTDPGRGGGPARTPRVVHRHAAQALQPAVGARRGCGRGPDLRHRCRGPCSGLAPAGLVVFLPARTDKTDGSPGGVRVRVRRRRSSATSGCPWGTA